MSGGYSIFAIREVILKKRVGLYDSKLPEPGGFLLSCVSLFLILWSKKTFLYLNRVLKLFLNQGLQEAPYLKQVTPEILLSLCKVT